MDRKSYLKTYTEEDAVGWLAIDEAVKNIYRDIPPNHYGPLCGVHYIAGGTDPIDGVSIYESKKQTAHKHLVSYGMSELYFDPDKAGGEFSKWGFEFTMRLMPFEDEPGDPIWAIEVMNNLARYVFQSGNWFEENHFIPSNGPIRMHTDSDIVGLALALDPELGRIQTPHGEVSFLQLVGITSRELERLKANPSTSEVERLINELRKENPLLITDLKRKT